MTSVAPPGAPLQRQVCAIIVAAHVTNTNPTTQQYSGRDVGPEQHKLRDLPRNSQTARGPDGARFLNTVRMFFIYDADPRPGFELILRLWLGPFY
jgi:hypothetical protein